MDKIKEFLTNSPIIAKLKNNKKILIISAVVLLTILFIYLIYNFVIIPSKYMSIIDEYSQFNQKMYISIIDKDTEAIKSYDLQEMMSKLDQLVVEYRTDKKEGIQWDFLTLLGEYYMAYVMCGFYDTTDDNIGNYDNDLESLFNPSASNTINFMGQNALLYSEYSYKEFIDKYAIFGRYNAIDERIADKIEQHEATKRKEEAKPEEYDKIQEIESFIVSDMWNKMCEISWYTSRGTSSTGDNLDINLVILQIENSMPKLEEYNTYMNSLKEVKYQSIKKTWNKLYAEIKRIYNLIQNSKPILPRVDINGFDLGLFEQYREAFEDYYDELDIRLIEDMSLKDALNTIDTYRISDMWNKMCNIWNCVSGSTISNAEVLDAEFVLYQMNNSQDTLKIYNSYINNLSGEEYNMLKLTWRKLYDEYNKQLDILNNASPIKRNSRIYGFSVDLLEQYSTAFADEWDKIERNLE